jgi:hypothetical protein
MVHGQAHVHEHRPHEIERRALLDDRSNPFADSYDSLSKEWEDAFGSNDATTKEDTATTTKNTMMGVGPAVAATRTSSETTEKPTEAPATTAKNTEKHEASTTESEKETKTESHATQTKEHSTETTKETQETKAEATTTSEDNNTATKIEPTSTPTASFVTSIASPTADSSQDVNALAATNTASATNSAASASSSSLNTESEGMSSGAKAGIAIGVILGVGVIAALIFFFIRKKKRSQALEEEENEKAAFSLPPPPPIAKPSTPSTPPQLKVRPVTQFAPDLSGNGGFNPATAAGAAAAAGVGAGTAAVASRNISGNSPPTPPKSAAGSNPFNDPVNPFGNNTPVAEYAPAMPGSAVAGAAAMGAVGGAAMASHDRAHSPPGSSPSPVSIDGESVASATFAADGAAGMSAVAGAAAGTSPNNVHRVQMDFNPSMEDELGLRTGSLVRMLHEYDDGWVSDFMTVTQVGTSTYISLPGSLCSSRSISARGCSTVLPFCAPCEASLASSPWSSRSSSHGP